MPAFAKRIVSKPEFGPFVLLLAMVIIFWELNPAFLSLRNISNTLAFTVELGLIALAMTLLMTSGEFDLSVGSLFGFSPVLMWTLYNTGIASIEISFAIALATACKCVVKYRIRCVSLTSPSSLRKSSLARPFSVMSNGGKM